MTENLEQLRERASHPKALHGCSSDPCGSVVCQTARDRDTLLNRVEAAERINGSFAREVNNLTGELSKFKDAYSLQAQELEQAEQALAAYQTRDAISAPVDLDALERAAKAEAKLATLEAQIEGENLRWVAWEMVENSGQLDLPDVAWINKIAEGEVSLEAGRHHFFGGQPPCDHLSGYEPFDIEDENRPACEHCNRATLDGGEQE